MNTATLPARKRRPIKVLQFGEGNFLRAFFDWMLQVTNDHGLTDMSVAVVSPRFRRSETLLNLQAQQGLFHLVLEGIDQGRPVRSVQLIDTIAEAFTPLDNPERYRQIIESEDLKIVVSNTTEAGIRCLPDDILADCPVTFPGKVTSLLWRRFSKFGPDPDKGLLFICCELIEDNGAKLRKYVLHLAANAGLPTEFTTWVETACAFCDTLVDRIVPGFPADKIDEIRQQIGCDDKCVVTAEHFHLWAIGGQGYEKARQLLPLDSAGLNVMFMPSIKAFRDKKVRVLNGSHTGLVPVALQLGCATVLEAFGHPLVNKLICDMVQHEVLPMIDGDSDELRAFADSILERFYNPYLRHELKSIALNSLSKWEARNWSTVADNFQRRGALARREIFTFAALLALYGPGSGFEPDDNPAHVQLIRDSWNPANWESTVSAVVNSKVFIHNFEREIPGFTALAACYLASIKHDGMEQALLNLFKES